MHDARDSQPHASDTLVNAILDAFVEALPAYLVSQRWFADKHRTIASISITDFSLVETGQTTLLLAIAGVRFTDRTTARYFVPAVLDGQPPRAGGAICTLSHGGRQFVVLDAITSPGFHAWLIDSIRSDHVASTAQGRVQGHLDADQSWTPRGLSGRAAGFEQSNSSILFEDTLIAKVYRRLSDGTNPDVEVGRFLTNICGFAESPQL